MTAFFRCPSESNVVRLLSRTTLLFPPIPLEAKVIPISVGKERKTSIHSFFKLVILLKTRILMDFLTKGWSFG